MMSVDLTGRVALVTGAGGAIGGEIVRIFAQNGADVVVNDIDEKSGRAVANEISETGKKALFISADVGDRDQCQAMAVEIRRSLGRLDILVNNAGINVGPDERHPIHEFSDERWHGIINTDLNGIYYCSKPLINMISEGGHGRIINIGSVVGVVPFRLQSAFAAAKAGVLHLTKAMALELAPLNINVNAIAPGSIMTEGTKALFYADKKRAEAILSHIPLGRAGTPREVANAALFLASDEAGYVTGSVLVVDGGWTCGGVFWYA